MWKEREKRGRGNNVMIDDVEKCLIIRKEIHKKNQFLLILNLQNSNYSVTDQKS